MGSVKRWWAYRSEVHEAKPIGQSICEFVSQSDYEALERDRDKLAAKVERVRALLPFLADHVMVKQALADEEHPDFGPERREGERREGHEHLYDAGSHIRYCLVGLGSGLQRRSGRDRRGAK